MKPAVNGMPANDKRVTVKTVASRGLRQKSPWYTSSFSASFSFVDNKESGQHLANKLFYRADVEYIIFKTQKKYNQEGCKEILEIGCLRK